MPPDEGGAARRLSRCLHLYEAARTVGEALTTAVQRGRLADLDSLTSERERLIESAGEILAGLRATLGGAPLGEPGGQASLLLEEVRQALERVLSQNRLLESTLDTAAAAVQAQAENLSAAQETVNAYQRKAVKDAVFLDRKQ